MYVFFFHIRILYVIALLNFHLFGVFCTSKISENSLQGKYKSVYDSNFTGLFNNSNENNCLIYHNLTNNISIKWISNQLCEVKFQFPELQAKVILENSGFDLPQFTSCGSFAKDKRNVINQLEQLMNLMRSAEEEQLSQLANNCHLNNFIHLNISFNNLKNLNESKICLNLLKCVETPRCPSKLQLVDLSHNSLQKFNYKFCLARKLTILILSFNNIGIIIDDAFYNLENVLWINLNHNNLIVLPKEIFKKNIKLEILDLSHNQLTSDVGDSLLPLHELRFLLLDYNNIESIPYSINKLYNLEYLSIASNKLSTIDNCLSLDKLQFLLLGLNDLNSINETSLNKLEDLKELELFGNKIVQLSSNAFSGNRKLEYLNLESNKLTQVPKINKNQIRIFLINNNQIISLSKSTFVNFSMINNLDLSNNIIKDIEPGTFDANSILFLNLSGNNILNVENIFSETKIKTLDLNNNELKRLSFSQFPQSLEELKLLNNSISSLDIDDCVKHLVNKNMSLKFFKLRHISITNFENMCIPASVEKLDLSDNSIESFSFHPEYQKLFYRNAVNLKQVSLMSNNFSTIFYHNILTSRSSLIKYEFKSNPLKCNCDNIWLQDEFTCKESEQLQLVKTCIEDLNVLTCASADTDSLNYDYINLKNLPLNCNCSHVNEITNGTLTFVWVNGNVLSLNHLNIYRIMPNVFVNSPQLQVLNLADNKLTTLPPHLFNNLTELKHLNLSGNFLCCLPNDLFLRIKQLEILQLYNNSLKQFELSQFDEMERLKEITLTGNPFSCNCTFATKVHDYTEKFVLRSELKCIDENRKEIPFAQLKSSYCQAEVKMAGSHSWPYIFGACAGITILLAIMCCCWKRHFRKRSFIM